MRYFFRLALGAVLVLPCRALADCWTTVNGVSVNNCPTRTKQPPASPTGDVPPETNGVIGAIPGTSAADTGKVIGKILGDMTHPPAPLAPKGPGDLSAPPQDLPVDSKTGMATSPGQEAPGNAPANPPVNGGASNPSGPTGTRSMPPAAAAKSGAAQEKSALGATGASANALSIAAGDKYLLANQPEDAERNYQRALAADPNNASALTGHVQALGALGRKDEALAAARRLLALEPSNPVAKGAIAEEHAENATSKFKKMTDAFLHGQTGENLPDRPAGKGAAAPGADAQYGFRPQAAPAQVPFAEGVRGGDTGLTFGPLLQKALRKQAVGDYTGALVDVSQEIDSNPKNAAAWTLRAELDLQLSNFPAGISDSTRALDLGPDNPRALRARSYGEYETRLYQQALADAGRAVALDPKNGLGFLYKAMAEDKLGLADAATSDLNQALALDPTLRRLAAPLLKKFNLGPGDAAPAGFVLKPWMLRGGFVGVAMLLVFVGLLGTQKAKTLRVLLTPRRAQTDVPAVAVDLAPGTVLGGTYRIVREIGRGGMGVVYEGLDQALQRRVAVKRLIQDEQTVPEDVERFLREARLVAQLKHPNLAQIYAVTVEREPFLVFEYVDGETLNGVLSRSVVLPVPAARRIVGEIASALTYAHEHNVIHRDLKPSNVMIAKNGAAKVMDFGIAHRSRSSATQLTQTIACGTPPYMAPEQGMGSVSKASDLYALGVMTYELLTGRRPFDGPNYLNQKLERRYEPATRVNPELPAALDHFFETALDPDPTKRPASAAAFMEAFGRACDATPRRQASAA